MTATETQGYKYQLTSSKAGGYVLAQDHSEWMQARAPDVEQFADCTLVVGGEKGKREIHTSRLLLAINSDFFKGFFEADRDMEKDPKQARCVVPLPDLDGQVVDNLVAGLLSGWVYVDNSLEGLRKLFHAVDFLQLEACDGICTAVCRGHALDKDAPSLKGLQQLQAKEGGKKALAEFLVKAATLAERYKRTGVTDFVMHLVTEDPEVWELQEERLPSVDPHIALQKLRASQKEGKFPGSQCAMFSSATPKFCDCEV